MKTHSQEYKNHLEKKYLPGRSFYLRKFYYPKIYNHFGPQKIYDFGCGTGEFLRYLKSLNRDFLGVDNNQFLVDDCNLSGLAVSFGDVTSLDCVADDSVMNAFCDNVLEHLTEDQINDFFNACSQKMKKDGVLVISVPGEKGFDHDPTHETMVTVDVIRKALQSKRGSLVNCYYHPINIPIVSKYFYLNMNIFVINF